jgi:hydroxymethylpyrimidine pyrophosphatase-like HAD family hydrolase
MQDLLEKIDVSRKNILIFDIDGTLRPDEVEALDHRHPRISPKTAKQLSEINLVKNINVLILTARSYVDVFKSNLPKSIIKYCGCGKQIIDNDVLRYAREEFLKSYDETVMFIDLIKDILGPTLIFNVDFLITPGDFAMYFDFEDYQQTKESIMGVLQTILRNSARWKMVDLGKEVIFTDQKYRYDKGNAVVDIVSDYDLIQELAQVFMFGDSPADYKAMEALRHYQKTYPEKRLKVNNICVGSKIANFECVDYCFTSYTQTLEFVDILHQKLVKPAI